MKKGFTLVEMIVALMIFSIVSVVALTALVKIIDANKKAQNIQDAVVSMSFTMESMTRELRTGSIYYCRTLLLGENLNVSTLSSQSVSPFCNGVTGNSTNGQGIGFAFLSNRVDSLGRRLINAYEIVPNIVNNEFNGTFSLKKASQTQYDQNIEGLFVPIIDTNSLSLTKYYLQVNDTNYPLLFLKLEGSSGNRESLKTYFNIQTAASPRVP